MTPHQPTRHLRQLLHPILSPHISYHLRLKRPRLRLSSTILATYSFTRPTRSANHSLTPHCSRLGHCRRTYTRPRIWRSGLSGLVLGSTSSDATFPRNPQLLHLTLRRRTHKTKSAIHFSTQPRVRFSNHTPSSTPTSRVRSCQQLHPSTTSPTNDSIHTPACRNGPGSNASATVPSCALFLRSGG